MKCWLITNKYLQGEKYDVIVNMFLSSAKELNIQLEHKYNDQVLAYVGEKIEDKPDFVIFWDKDIQLCKYLESQGIPVYNSSYGIATTDDKGATAIALAGIVPMPRTIVVPMTYTNIGYTDYSFVTKAVNSLGLPVVIKESHGSYGKQVYLANTLDEALAIVENIGASPMILQEYIAESFGKDIRLEVVGNQVIASMLRENKNDFRANITNGGSATTYTPTAQEKDIAITAIKSLGLTFGGVDILFSNRGPLVCEVNSNAHFKNLYNTTGIDASKEILKYIVNSLSNKK